jgi:hypothetical protein
MPLPLNKMLQLQEVPRRKTRKSKRSPRKKNKPMLIWEVSLERNTEKAEEEALLIG